MKIGITLTSSLAVGQEYIDLARSIARLLANEKFGIVYGGTEYGMMKELAESYKQAGGSDLSGVMSKELESVTKGYKAYAELDEEVWVQSIGERISTITSKADGFLILPGGYGTIEEMGVIIGAKANKLFNKPIILFNHNGFYNNLIEFFIDMFEKSFTKVPFNDLVKVVDSEKDIISFFKNYSGADLPDKFI